MRLDRAVADLFHCGRRRARAMIQAGLVRMDGRLAKPSTLAPSGAAVSLYSPPPRAEPSAVETRTPTILSDGDGLLAIAKPAGLHSHAGRGAGSVADWLYAQRPELVDVGGGRRECGLVHRLDRDTSGILLAATNTATYRALRTALAEHRVIKRYLALVEGVVEAPMSVVRSLARRRTRVVPARRGDRSLAASTQVRPLAAFGGACLVEATMRTGVTHQIRAHLALSGYPIVGDVKYGGPPAPPGTRAGHLLHAAEVILPSGQQLRCPTPEDFETARAMLAGDG